MTPGEADGESGVLLLPRIEAISIRPVAFALRCAAASPMKAANFPTPDGRSPASTSRSRNISKQPTLLAEGLKVAAGIR